jgi:hypothetical protein
MPKIFICYRREDSAYPAHQIYRDLSDHFGSESVVFDVDTIPLGTDFREYLNNEVSKCDILLAVIGDRWIEILTQQLDEPNDFVRIEIQAALESEIPVVPILVGRASVPSENNLPPALAKLAYKQAAEVRAGPDLQTHLKRLIGGLERLLSDRKGEEKRKQKEAKDAADYDEAYKHFTNQLSYAYGRYRDYISGRDPENKKYTEIGVLERMNEVKSARLQLLSVCGEHVRNILLDAGSDWLNDIDSFGTTAPLIEQRLSEEAFKDRS